MSEVDKELNSRKIILNDESDTPAQVFNSNNN